MTEISLIVTLNNQFNSTQLVNFWGIYAPFGTFNTETTQFSAFFSSMLWHIELIFLIWLCYPRATRCGGDNVTLLWFRPSVCPSVCACVRQALPCEHDRNLTVVCLFIKFGRQVHYDDRMNRIDFGGQRSKVKVTIDIHRNKLVDKTETKPLCASPP